ncbi:uncharacterized protein LOC116188326 isoform X2 [Punica granatum]|uniref:Uncharacterized protein LOC116188326 isoform X2 n=1 Tax=Punica granatum TaxID=22663 RepID=A0A6P8BW46_PUNGR|nr:uncharacterized protein LOC116188326 isoform X2 [Punica granatum]
MRFKSRASKGQTSINKGGGDEGTSSQSQGEYALGSLIWIKLRSNSWWPAQVVDENVVSEVNKPAGRSPVDVLVRIYGSYQYVYADLTKCLSEFETVLRQNNGSYLDIFQRALEQDVLISKAGGSKGGGSKRKGAAKARTGASKNIRPSRRPARGNLDVQDTPGKQAAAATPETKAKRKGRTSRKDKQDGTSNEPEGTGTLEIEQESVSGRLKSHKRTAAEKTKVGISRQAPANPEQDGHQKAHLPSKGRISKKEEKATAENDEGQKKRRLSTLYADERLKDKQPEQEKPDSKKAKMSSAKKEGKSEVPKLAESVKKEKPVSPTRTGLLLVCFIQAPKLLAKPEELRTRRLKVMKTLGLIGPSGSPFHRNGQIIVVD